MDTELKDKITRELLKTRFYSVPANNKRYSEFAYYKVYKLKDIDLCEQLFASPPPNDNNADYCQSMNDEINFSQCIYCGKQRACQRRENICCVCGRCFDSRNELTDHDEENICSDICCRCNDVAKSGKPENFLEHLNKCARKNGSKYAYTFYTAELSRTKVIQMCYFLLFFIRK